MAAPWISFKQVRWAAGASITDEKRVAPGPANPKDDVEHVAAALTHLGYLVKGEQSSGYKHQTGYFDAPMNAAYKLFQESQYGRGPDSDGLPGHNSMLRLADKSGKFQVRDFDGIYKPVYVATPPPVVKPPVVTPATGRASISPREVTFDRYTGGGTPDQWINEACTRAGVTPSAYWRTGLKTIMGRESSGNPNVCNLWDSNAVTPAGYSKVADYGDGAYANGSIRKLNGALTHFQCSRGAWQTIPTTFARNHAAGTSNSIYNPVATCAAAILYVRETYGVALDGKNLAARVQQADPARDPRGY